MTTPQNNSEVVAIDPTSPTQDELKAMGHGLFVRKTGLGTNVVTSYHRWENVFSSGLRLHVQGENTASTYRALALSVPAHQPSNAVSDGAEVGYLGYVFAFPEVGGPSRAIPMMKVEWIQH